MSGKPQNGCYGKRRYRDNISALLALASTNRAGRGERRAYRCPVCHGFHLTRQPSVAGGDEGEGSNHE